MATWLAFDAGSPVTSAAVARDGEVLGESSGEGRGGPSLLHHVDLSLRRAAVAASRLDGIAVLRGPGSFTGIRVALSTALGFRAALEVPVFALSNLAALAENTFREGDAGILALVDALREEWFAQSFRRVGDDLSAEAEPERIPPSAIQAPPGTVVAAHLGQPIPACLAPFPLRRAAALAGAVASATSSGRLGKQLDTHLEPLYLRAFTPRLPQR